MGKKKTSSQGSQNMLAAYEECLRSNEKVLKLLISNFKEEYPEEWVNIRHLDPQERFKYIKSFLRNQ